MTTQTEALKMALESAYLAGFNASGEGYNGEYPFDEVVHTPVENRVWKKDRDNYIKEALAQQEGQSNYCLQCEALSRELAALKTQQSNEQSKCNHTKTITRADIDGNQIETTCGECGERVAQQSNEQVEPVAWRWPYKFKDIGETGAYEYHSHEFACLAHLPKGEPLYAHPPVPTAQPEQESTNLERHKRNVHKFLGTPQPKEPEQNLKLMPREATPEMLKAMDECSTEGYDERLYEGHAGSVYMAAWDAFYGQHCYCGDITNLGVIHRDDGPCHYPDHTSEYKRGYADAMNWKMQNHLEHLPPKEPEQEPVAFLTNHRQRMNVQIKPEAFVWMPTTTDWEVPLYTTPPQRTWVGLMRGVRVDGDNVVISAKGGNDAARELCAYLIDEMN